MSHANDNTYAVYSRINSRHSSDDEMTFWNFIIRILTFDLSSTRMRYPRGSNFPFDIRFTRRYVNPKNAWLRAPLREINLRNTRRFSARPTTKYCFSSSEPQILFQKIYVANSRSLFDLFNAHPVIFDLL